MRPNLKWPALAAGKNWPGQFRVVVISEVLRWEDKKTFQMQEKTVYVAIAMEWDVVVQGDTVDGAVHILEQMLFSNAVVQCEHQDSAPLKPAPEKFQRIATTGDWCIETDPEWAEIAGDRNPVVHRTVIDMTKSQWRTTPFKETP